MDFRTQVPFYFQDFEISHKDTILMIGSCFVENLGNKLQNYKFDTELNPFGILFNPYSIANSINRIINLKFYTEADLFFHNEMYHSWDHHSVFSGIKMEEVLDNINSKIKIAHKHLFRSSTLFITFGSAFAYLHKPLYTPVANCHKVEANKFVKKLYETDELFEIYKQLIYDLQFFNSKLNIVLTVSPVRHLKDGFMENNVSKGILFQLIYKLLGTFKQSFYFPSYEIVMDELRDYRFFGKDMIHPNDQAIDFIWEQFGKNYFNDETNLINKNIEEICKDINHKPFNIHSEGHQKFIQNLKKKINIFNTKYPYIAF
jgi:hypothetical protein